MIFMKMSKSLIGGLIIGGIALYQSINSINKIIKDAKETTSKDDSKQEKEDVQKIKIDAITITINPEEIWKSVDPVLKKYEYAVSEGLGKIKIGDGKSRWSEIEYTPGSFYITETGKESDDKNENSTDPKTHHENTSSTTVNSGSSKYSTVRINNDSGITWVRNDTVKKEDMEASIAKSIDTIKEEIDKRTDYFIQSLMTIGCAIILSNDEAKTKPTNFEQEIINLIYQMDMNKLYFNDDKKNSAEDRKSSIIEVHKNTSFK